MTVPDVPLSRRTQEVAPPDAASDCTARNSARYRGRICFADARRSTARHGGPRYSWRSRPRCAGAVAGLCDRIVADPEWRPRFERRSLRCYTGSGQIEPSMGTDAARFLLLWIAGWVNSRHSHNELFVVGSDARTPGPAARRAVVLAGDQLAVPAQDRVRRDQPANSPSRRRPTIRPLTARRRH